MNNKNFSYSLKQKYDVVGKKLACEIMRDLTGAKLIEENVKEDSGDFSDGFWDQKYEIKGKEVKVEPEMKDSKWWGLSWSEDRPFKYDTMDIPFRKAKNIADVHIVISTCEKYAFILTRKSMNEALQESGGSPKIKRTMYEPNGAPYFSTNVKEGFFVEKLQSGRWKRWNTKSRKLIRF